MNLDAKVQMISIELIIPNRFQPRLTFDETSLNELAASIKEHGIIQPLVLRKIADRYEIIAGERRYKAATIAGLTEVPAVITNLDDNQSAEVALVENVQRQDLSSIEEAKSYRKILDKGYLTQEQLAKKMGISQSAIANKLRLLNLAPAVQEALMTEKISERHARSLLQLTDSEAQMNMLNRVINERLTVRQLDSEIKNIITPSSPVANIFDNPVPGSEAPVFEANPISIEPSVPEFNLEPSPEASSIPVEIESSPPPTVEANQSIEIEPLDKAPIETFEIDEPSLPSSDEPETGSDDIISKATNKMFGVFNQKQFSSLEDEVVNMNIDGSAPAFNPFKQEDFEPDEVKPEPELSVDPVIPVQKIKEPEKKVKADNLPSVAEAYHDLEAEVKAAGYQITSEEFDFEDLYQIIIKIDKPSEKQTE